LLATQFNFKGDRGILVSDVIAGSPAETAGLKAGDIIVKIDSTEIGKVEEFEEAFSAVKEGDSVRLTVFGEDKISEITLLLKP
jgi:S1-C subfamily serine protease